MISIVEATQHDLSEIAMLLNDIDAFYGDPVTENLPERVNAIKSALFSKHPSARVLLARIDNQTVGLAALSYLWPAAGSSSSIYLKELYVRDGFRNQGVGTSIFKHVCMTALDFVFRCV